MRIPHMHLSSAALQAIVEEFVTRDGTDHSSVERRIEKVLLQLQAGRVELHFDSETQTCNILPVEENPSAGGRNEWRRQPTVPTSLQKPVHCWIDPRIKTAFRRVFEILRKAVSYGGREPRR